MDWQKEQIRVGIIALILILTVPFSKGQEENEKPSYIQPGLLTASGTLAPSKMLNRNEVNYYIVGFLEGRITRNYSVRGDIQALLGNNDSKFLKNNIRITCGLQYGMPFGNFEWHAGLAPGVAYMESYRAPSQFELVPVGQLNLGVRFYIWKYFNFFADVFYTHATMHNIAYVDGRSDEIRLEAGLGYNFQVLKKYRNPGK